jgi:hypothetical protein
MKEIWKDIQGYEGIYQVSNLGRVKRFKYIGKTQVNQVLKGSLQRTKYINITLFGKEKKAYPIHRLVAQAFIPNPNNYPIINHIDENPSNNAAKNLEWCTYAYNNTYGLGMKNRIKTHSRKVFQYTTGYNLVKVWENAKQAEKEGGFKTSNIHQCCNGEKKTHRGFIWSHIPLEKCTDEYRIRCKYFRTKERCGVDNKKPNCKICGSYKDKNSTRF